MNLYMGLRISRLFQTVCLLLLSGSVVTAAPSSHAIQNDGIDQPTKFTLSPRALFNSLINEPLKDFRPIKRRASSSHSEDSENDPGFDDPNLTQSYSQVMADWYIRDGSWKGIPANRFKKIQSDKPPNKGQQRVSTNKQDPSYNEYISFEYEADYILGPSFFQSSIDYIKAYSANNKDTETWDMLATIDTREEATAPTTQSTDLIRKLRLNFNDIHHNARGCDSRTQYFYQKFLTKGYKASDLTYNEGRYLAAYFLMNQKSFEYVRNEIGKSLATAFAGRDNQVAPSWTNYCNKQWKNAYNSLSRDLAKVAGSQKSPFAPNAIDFDNRGISYVPPNANNGKGQSPSNGKGNQPSSSQQGSGRGNSPPRTKGEYSTMDLDQQDQYESLPDPLRAQGGLSNERHDSGD